MRVVLIRTCSPDAKGSMAEYARMVKAALGDDNRFALTTCDLFPARSRSMWHDHVWRLMHARRLLQNQESDLFHLLDGSMLAFIPNRMLSKTVVTVHDLIPWLQWSGKLPGRPSRAAAWIIRSSIEKLRYVAAIVAESENTVKDLYKAANCNDVRCVPLPTRPLLSPSADMDLPKQYILHVGNNALYKNRIGVLRVFSRLADQKDLWLVMAGPAPTEVLRREAAKLERVRFMIDVSDADLSALYQQAALLLFPSLYEGFGMPVREAQAAGCPVVCSTAASLPEVAGDAALMADADDIDKLAKHCRALLIDQDLRMRICALGRTLATAYTLERFGGEIGTWYERVLDKVLK